MPRRQSLTQKRWLLLGWSILVAVLPLWLGLPLLLSLATLAVLLQHRLDAGKLSTVRYALRWGLAGLLVAVFRAWDGDTLAVVAALLAALVGFTLLAGLEAWLDRDRRRSSEPPATTEWPELAQCSLGPPAKIIELLPLQWHATPETWADPSGDTVVFCEGGFDFGRGQRVDEVVAIAAFSPRGRWFAARMAQDRGVVLWDRERDRQRRLPGWKLCGWHDEQPWLNRHADDPPQTLTDAGAASSED